MKLNKVIEYNLKKFRELGINNPLQEIRYIVLEKIGISLEDQIFKKELVINKSQILELEEIFEERKKRKPLSKIFKKVYFRDIILSVNEHTFSPRIDTEVLIDVLIQQKINFKNILELGTGTGAISISLLNHYKTAKSVVTDISKEAIYIAKKNAIFNKTNNRMHYICCDWLSCFKNLNFDILISNPPYIIRSEIKNLEVEVNKYDPLISLDGGYDGLAAYRKILGSIKLIGKKNLLVLFEIGFNQAAQVADIMNEYGLEKIQVFNDYCNLPRCILGKV